MRLMLSIIIFVILTMIYMFNIVNPCELTNSCGQYILPDSKLYINIANSDSWNNVPWNVSGISIVYKFLNNYFNYTFFIMVVFIIINVVFFNVLINKKIINKSSDKNVFLLFLLNPQTIYYIQSPTKEILLYICSIIFLIALLKLKVKFKSTVSYLVISVFGLIIRIQYGLSFITSIFSLILKKNDRIKYVCITFFVLILFLPIIYQLDFLHTYLVSGERFDNSSANGTGFGLILRNYEKVYFGFTLISVPIKIFQNILDPFPSINLLYDHVFNFYGIKDALSFIFIGYVTLSVFFIIVSIIYGARRYRFIYELNSILFVIITIMYFFVGINTFIHGRYLYPILPIVMVFYFLSKKNRNDYLSLRRIRKLSLILWFFISLFIILKLIV